MTETVHGIEYSHPQVVLLQDTGIGTSELAARTCYDSFNASENEAVIYTNTALKIPLKEDVRPIEVATYVRWQEDINGIEHSDLLDTLAWTHFHHSILEHANLTYLIRGTSRGVLQEHARHRIQGISVRSTRYTMSSVINAFVAGNTRLDEEDRRRFFVHKLLEMDLFITKDIAYNRLEASSIYDKLLYQYNMIGENEFYNIALSKDAITNYWKNGKPGEHHPPFSYEVSLGIFKSLESSKKKRNVGDAFKHIVTDNWKVDMVVTFNLRSLKNYFQLRDSGAAYFQIQWLAKAMKEVTPSKYLDLIVKAN